MTTRKRSAAAAHAKRTEAHEPSHIKLLDRRQFTWEMPGNNAYRRVSRDGGDVFITENAPANLHADVIVDPVAGEAHLWIGITDQNNPPAYNRCYAVIGGTTLQDAARRILAVGKQPRPPRKRTAR